ncbi:MAG: cytochrome c [Proteobacteria bacterium]|nr:cytochrome c [Pseudomonadota bacterium]MBU1686109.1 cytochrome c [Pseudomonadota bacterium]
MVLQRIIFLMMVLSALTLTGCGGGSSSGSAGDTATITGSLASNLAAGPASYRVASVPAGMQVFAVDESGRSTDLSPVDGSSGHFSVEVPTGHDYVLIFTDGTGITAAMLYGANGQSVFTVGSGTTSIDLGTVTLDEVSGTIATSIELPPPTTGYHNDMDQDHIPDNFEATPGNSSGHQGDADNDEDGDHDGDSDGDHDGDEDGSGGETNPPVVAGSDAVLGGNLFQANGCAVCHSASSLHGVSLSELTSALQSGPESMPEYPSLVSNAADIQAYLNQTTTSTGGTTTTTTGGATTTTVGTTTTTTVGTQSPDATLGGNLFQANGCSACHGTGSGFKGISLSKLTSVLQSGKGSMPAYPSLVGNATDIQAYLNQ